MLFSVPFSRILEVRKNQLHHLLFHAELVPRQTGVRKDKDYRLLFPAGLAL